MARIDVDIDGSEVRNLYLDLSGAPARVQWNVPKGIARGARLVEREMKVDARNARRHNPSRIKHLPKAVTSEMLDLWTAEIGLGPRPGTQGSMAHWFAYGTSRTPPIYDHTAGLRRATPRIVRILADAGEESILGDD